ncbi:MAG: sigma-54 dependent transcriptional regulator [Thermodesulfovibrionales bacterium]|nr:sigma-54 dependent transcriptional regulator [Thermodesulfovibrionales bacterium]
MDTILIIEDKESMLRMLDELLKEEGFNVIKATDGPEALKKIKDEKIEVILTDLRLPSMDGIEILREVKAIDPSIPVIVMTAYGSIETAVEAMKLGASDFITKPFNPDHLLVVIKKVLDSRKLLRENMLLKEETSRKMPVIIGKSPLMVELMQKVHKVARTKTTVLIQGESGTGKELIAKAIHYLSDRSENPFVTINCAAIPRELLESELFGYEKGAFTGADSRKPGKFELADRGTIFLDEIGEMELTLQAKILRIIEDGMLERIGSVKPLPVDVRIIAASNRDLASEVSRGRFREDLFYRLNVFPLYVPPLRERKEDIPLLVEHFLKKFSKELKQPLKNVSKEAMELLLSYNWKGNVRELENTIERALILSDGDSIRPEHISIFPHNTQPEGLFELIPMDGALEDTSKAALRIAESERIKRALRQTGGNKLKAAEILKVSYKTLLTKIKEYNLE